MNEQIIRTHVKHESAKASHYDKEAIHYDAFNEERSVPTNQLIEKILKEHEVHSVLDLTCGTGSQVFWLAKRGFDVVGVDINEKMLAIAQEKANKQKMDIKFIRGDMRTSQIGQFEAVLSIFNSIGHLSQQDFEKSLMNINNNLRTNGLYLFDIYNLDYLLYEDNITKLTIDWQKKSGDVIAREIQYSTINQEGVLASYDIYHEQKGSASPTISTAYQTLQVYSAEKLENLLDKSGFRIIKLCSLDGSDFMQFKTERILTVAQKL
ncbi:TPA: methyltransferase domain-containing protein [Legionella pneumophila]